MLKEKYIGWGKLALWAFLLIYAVLKAYSYGTDINYYLHASQILFDPQNTVASTVYDNYLYSPLFIILIRPLSILPLEWGRVVWALINVFLVFRLWLLAKNLLTTSFKVSKEFIAIFGILFFLLSFDSLNNNLVLGQITVVMLWLGLEGVYQIFIQKKDLKGAFFIALGINIKILSIIIVFYLVLKGKFKATAFCILLVFASLLLPSLIVGHNYNMDLLLSWQARINPTKVDYVFENDDGCNSLNAMLPAYFYDFGSPTDNNMQGFKRKIAFLSAPTLLTVLQLSRLLLVFSFLGLIFYRYKNRQHPQLYLWWEMSYLMLISFLIFPHQLKYSQFYYTPACAYLLLFAFLLYRNKPKQTPYLKTLAIIATTLLFVVAAMGRDIIGDYLLDILDFYHVSGVLFLVFLVFLWLIKPPVLLTLQDVSNNKSQS